jgi:5-methylcytosine-specific restriction protein B
MSRAIPERDLEPVIDAAQKWIESCLVSDRSIFSTEPLWTSESLLEVETAFVGHPDLGDDDFMTKLQGQLERCSTRGCKLMAEVLWILLLFPSSLKPDTKRRHVIQVWGFSGDVLSASHPLLRDAVLIGIGGAGQAFNTHRHREIEFLLQIARSTKKLDAAVRRDTFAQYDTFMKWFRDVPQKGDRQFRHMLRYFAFPDRVERMSSNFERRAVLKGFGIAPETTIESPGGYTRFL